MTEPVAVRLPYKGGFPVYPSRYVLCGTGERHAALRFFNASEIGVTGIRFRIVEKDGRGDLLADRVVERDGLFAESGKEFAVADVGVDYACASVEIEVQSVFSDEYEYVFGEDGVSLKYGRTEKEAERKLGFVHRATYSVSKRRKRYVWIAVFAVFGIAVLAAALAWRFGFFGKIERVSAEAETISRSDWQDYEA